MLAFVIAMTVVAARLEWKEFKRLSNGTVPAYAGDSGPVVTAGAGAVPEEGEDTMEKKRDCKCGRCGDEGFCNYGERREAEDNPSVSHAADSSPYTGEPMRGADAERRLDNG